MERMLVVKTPAADRKIVTGAEIAADLGPLASGVDEAALTTLAGAASAVVQSCCNIEIVREAVEETFWLDADRLAIHLERTPIADGAVVSVDGAVVDPDFFTLDLRSGSLWRRSSNSIVKWARGTVVVSYSGGYATGDIPLPAKLSALSVARRLLAQRRRDPLVKSERIDGVMSRDYWIGPTGPSMLNADELAMLNAFQRIRS